MKVVGVWTYSDRLIDVPNDKCSDGHLFGMTMILSYKYLMRKKFFAPINFQVFLKHLPGHKESIGILGEQIRQWEGSEKSGRTNTQEHGHPQIIIWILPLLT